MNFETLKLGFQRYLLDIGEISEREMEISNSTVSIFMHAQEFKDYLFEELNVDSSILSMSVNDILKMDIVNGKLVDSNDGENTTPTTSDSSLETLPFELAGNGENPDIDNNGIVSGILNELMQTDEFSKMIDTDGDSTLSNDEILTFLNAIKGFDENEDDISIDDIYGAITAVQDGSLTIEPIETEDTPEVTVDTPTVDNVKTPHLSGGGYTGGPIQPYSPTTSPTVSYNTMTLEQLGTKKNEQQGIITTATANIEDFYTNKNSDLEEYKNTFNSNLDVSDQNLKNEISNYTTNVTKTKNSINTTKSQIATLSSAISDLQSQSDAYASDIAALKDALGALDPSAENYTAQQTSINGQIEDLEGKKGEVDGELEQKEAEKKRLEETTLPNPTTTLTGYDTARNTIIETYGDAAAAILDEFDTNIAQIETSYDNQIAAEQKKIDTAKTELGKIDEAINTKNARVIRNQYQEKSDLFGTNLNMTVQQINDGTTMPYLLIGPADADPNQELPVLFYLHGLGSVGGSLGNLQNIGPAAAMRNWGLEDFNGYIIYPLLNSGSWNTPTAEAKLRQLYSSFSETHAVDTDRVAIAGHSLGGQGALYMANAMPDIFTRAAAISPYNPGNIPQDGMKIPTRSYVGTADDPASYNYAVGALQGVIGQDSTFVINGANHSTMPVQAISGDSDGNGRSDWFEWLFGDVD